MALTLDTHTSNTPHSAWCSPAEEHSVTRAIATSPFGKGRSLAKDYLLLTAVEQQGWTADLSKLSGVTRNTQSALGTSAADPQGVPAKRAAAAIDQLTKLEEGWDGRKAVPVASGVAAAAIAFVRQIPPEQLQGMQSVPFTDGRLQLEWDRGERSLEIEFSSPLEVHYLKWDPANGIEDEGKVSPIAHSSLNGLVNWFFYG